MAQLFGQKWVYICMGVVCALWHLFVTVRGLYRSAEPWQTGSSLPNQRHRNRLQPVANRGLTISALNFSFTIVSFIA